MKHVNKKQIFFLFLFVIMLNGNIFSQINSFYVYFKQNDKKHTIKKAEAKLLQEPFRIYVEYTKPFDLLVNSSAEGKTYKDAVNGKLMFFLDGFKESELTESFFKTDKTLLLDENKTFIWEKKKTDNDSIIKISKRFVSVKNVDKVYYSLEKETLDIKDIKDDLYMVFIYTEKDRSGERQEIQRETVKIKWVKKYPEDTKSYKRDKKKKDKEKERAKKRTVKYKQRLEKKEEKGLKKLDKNKKKKEQKGKKKESKEKETA